MFGVSAAEFSEKLAEAFRECGFPPVKRSDTLVRTEINCKTHIPPNCKNCGAPLKSSKCEYCGTEYGASGQMEDWHGTVMINGEAVEVYISAVSYRDIGECYRDANGMMHQNGKEKRTFTLVEI